MLSIPPATTTSVAPTVKLSCASMTVFIPEPHTLLTVDVGTPFGTPAAIAACLAGACPTPAGRTHPMRTSLPSSGLTLASARAPDIALASKEGALKEVKKTLIPPMAVRAIPTITIGSDIDYLLDVECSAKQSHLTHERKGNSLKSMVRTDFCMLASSILLVLPEVNPWQASTLHLLGKILPSPIH